MVENAFFTENGLISANIDGVDYFIPDDMDNRHRAMLAEWEAEGNIIAPYVEAVLTPEELRAQMLPLTPRQFRDALIDHDIMPEQVTAAISQIADVKDRAKALNAWEYPTQFVRKEPLIEQIGAMFDITPEDIDDMWRQATA